MARIDNIISITNIHPPNSLENVMPISSACGALLRAQDIWAGRISQVSHPYAFTRPDSDHHNVVYTLSGTAQLLTRQEECTLQANDLFICPAHQPHAYLAGEAWHFVWLEVADTARWMAVHMLGAQTRPAPDFAKAIWAMEGFIEEGIRSNHTGNTATRCFSELILYYLDREVQPQGTKSQRILHEQMHRLWTHVNGHLQHPWTVGELAGFLSCSPTQLFRHTDVLFATTPMEMVTRLRIERVKELLASTEMKLEHIAALVGYATPFALSRAFRRLTGYSPSTFRARHLDLYLRNCRQSQCGSARCPALSVTEMWELPR